MTSWREMFFFWPTQAAVFVFVVVGSLYLGGYVGREPVQLTVTLAQQTEDVFAQAEVEVESVLTPALVLQQYVEVTESCGPHYDGGCLNARSGPGVEYAAVAQLRTGMVLLVKEAVLTESGTWYQVEFDEWLRYPERVSAPWYVSGAYVRLREEDPPQSLLPAHATATEKLIIVDRSDQRLYAYDGDDLFTSKVISTGLEFTPTPRGSFTVFKKTPTRYMQGPLPHLPTKDYYDLPGVPWNLYFTEGGAVIHGAYWHDNFGEPYSHGCVNLSPDDAREIFTWADIGTQVLVRD